MYIYIGAENQFKNCNCAPELQGSEGELLIEHRRVGYIVPYLATA